MEEPEVEGDVFVYDILHAMLPDSLRGEVPSWLGMAAERACRAFNTNMPTLAQLTEGGYLIIDDFLRYTMHTFESVVFEDWSPRSIPPETQSWMEQAHESRAKVYEMVEMIQQRYAGSVITYERVRNVVYCYVKT